MSQLGGAIGKAQRSLPPDANTPLPSAQALAFRTYLNEGRLITQAQVELAEIEECEWGRDGGPTCRAEPDREAVLPPPVGDLADLGGVLDFTGELGRLSVAQATRRDEAAVQQARDLTEGIMGAFLQVRGCCWCCMVRSRRCRTGPVQMAAPQRCLLAWRALTPRPHVRPQQFDLRNGSLRKKYDALKYTVRKMEVGGWVGWPPGCRCGESHHVVAVSTQALPCMPPIPSSTHAHTPLPSYPPRRTRCTSCPSPRPAW